ncbi:hypothetical protein CDIK_0880 [Cucumispora dikerogammari]|nr:hypothetical protein CDIK_0880 [Cucumispora dikerogammari]
MQETDKDFNSLRDINREPVSTNTETIPANEESKLTSTRVVLGKMAIQLSDVKTELIEKNSLQTNTKSIVTEIEAQIKTIPSFLNMNHTPQKPKLLKQTRNRKPNFCMIDSARKKLKKTIDKKYKTNTDDLVENKDINIVKKINKKHESIQAPDSVNSSLIETKEEGAFEKTAVSQNSILKKPNTKGSNKQKKNIKNKNIKNETIKNENIKNENIKKDNNKNENIKKENIKNENIKKDNNKNEDIKKDSIKNKKTRNFSTSKTKLRETNELSSSSAIGKICYKENISCMEPNKHQDTSTQEPSNTHTSTLNQQKEDTQSESILKSIKEQNHEINHGLASNFLQVPRGTARIPRRGYVKPQTHRVPYVTSETHEAASKKQGSYESKTNTPSSLRQPNTPSISSSSLNITQSLPGMKNRTSAPYTATERASSFKTPYSSSQNITDIKTYNSLDKSEAGTAMVNKTQTDIKTQAITKQITNNLKQNSLDLSKYRCKKDFSSPKIHSVSTSLTGDQKSSIPFNDKLKTESLSNEGSKALTANNDDSKIHNGKFKQLHHMIDDKPESHVVINNPTETLQTSGVYLIEPAKEIQTEKSFNQYIEESQPSLVSNEATIKQEPPLHTKIVIDARRSNMLNNATMNKPDMIENKLTREPQFDISLEKQPEVQRSAISASAQTIESQADKQLEKLQSYKRLEKLEPVQLDKIPKKETRSDIRHDELENELQTNIIYSKTENVPNLDILHKKTETDMCLNKCEPDFIQNNQIKETHTDISKNMEINGKLTNISHNKQIKISFLDIISKNQAEQNKPDISIINQKDGKQSDSPADNQTNQTQLDMARKKIKTEARAPDILSEATESLSPLIETTKETKTSLELDKTENKLKEEVETKPRMNEKQTQKTQSDNQDIKPTDGVQLDKRSEDLKESKVLTDQNQPGVLFEQLNESLESQISSMNIREDEINGKESANIEPLASINKKIKDGTKLEGMLNVEKTASSVIVEKKDVKDKKFEKKQKDSKRLKHIPDPNTEYLEFECVLKPNTQQTKEINKIRPPKNPQEDYDLDSDLFDNTNLIEENKLVKTEIEYNDFYVYANSKNVKNPQYLPGKYKLYFDIFDSDRNENSSSIIRKKCKFLINEILLMHPKKEEFFKFLNDINLIELNEIQTFYNEIITNRLLNVCFFIYYYKKRLRYIKPDTDNTTYDRDTEPNVQSETEEKIKETDFDFGTSSYESVFANYNLKDCDISRFNYLIRLLSEIIILGKEKSILNTCILSGKNVKYKTERGIRAAVTSNLLNSLVPMGDHKKIRVLLYKYEGGEFNEVDFKDRVFNSLRIP